MTAPTVYEFGDFRLELVERRLARGGHPVALEPKAYDLLGVLVGRAGHLITKRELLDAVWPGAFVEEGILTVHISHLRKALGDSAANPTFIETVARTGYRFIEPVIISNSGPAVLPRMNVVTSAAIYELVGRGRGHLLAASMVELPKAAAAFRAAIDLDPTYAAAHAGLALACCGLAELRVTPPAEAYAEAKSAALRALAMDPANSDAQVALGAVLFLGEWNWTAAERSFQRALQLNPDHTEAYLLYGRLLDARGRLDEGLLMKLRALERNPQSPLVLLQIATSYWNQRNYDAVIEWTNKALFLDPRHPHAREFLAGAYLHKGDPDRHMTENLRHAELHGVPPAALEPVRRAYAESGRPGVVRFVVTTLGKQPGASPLMLATHCAEIGEIDLALSHLHTLIERHDPALVDLAVAPQWDPLRGDARFAACLAKVGLTT